MFRRSILLLLAVMAVLTGTATTAAAQPGDIAQVPQGFPADLKRFVGGTEEFREANWFTDPDCADRGGKIGDYLTQVMFAEPRLLYWTIPPGSRKAFWITDSLDIPEHIDLTKEPPDLPKTFPAVDPQREAYGLPRGRRFCTDLVKQWTTPADNTWGLSWAPAPDPESLEKMKPFASAGDDEDMIHNFTHACEIKRSPYCQKAMFVDCGRIDPTDHQQKDLCFSWNVQVAQLFVGIGKWIDDNTSWLEKVGQLFLKVGLDVVAAGKVFVDAFVGILKFVLGIAKFVLNPAGALDDLANSIHESAVDFTTTVLQGLASVGRFDPGTDWFLSTYAASAGVGIVVMAFMTTLMLMRAASGKGSREELTESLFKHLPTGVFLAVFAPAAATVLVKTAQALTNGIIAWQAPHLTDAVGKIALLGGITAAALPGGVFIGLLLFLFMVIGTGALFVGLAMQSFALPMSGLVAGIAWGMWVHPRWRAKAMKVPLTFAGLLASQPLVFLMLGFAFSLIDATVNGGTVQSGGFRLLAMMVLVVVALLITGFAPWSLLKYSPLLPTAADSHDGQPGPGFGTSAVVGASVATLDRGGSGAEARPAPSSGPSQASNGGGTPSIQSAYARQQQPQGGGAQRPRAASPVAPAGATAGGRGTRPAAATGGGATGSGAGGQQRVAGAATGGAPAGAAGAGGAAQQGAAGTGAAAAKGGAALGGAALGGAAGPIGIAAQVGVAGFNKARSAAHARHTPEIDHDTPKED
ncbi:hypothetical protein [Actinokineospora cianjurensis]|uniref:TrbL/VirB6 plasmid conjugal transfer protein n=1 Tax=Actinokineospora cianjurensis TaxID=585224 RepID=A0A421B1Y3_9PSEU|nr:hypothetical protein [Actinokineospora cianjurensis]RLK58367.1 hypothetical protein CLV68_4465 [Actinokineospora cianjurensis]